MSDQMRLYWVDTDNGEYDAYVGVLTAAPNRETASELAEQYTKQPVNEVQYLGVAAMSITKAAVLYDSYHAG